ncbi:MAG: glycosyltransferase family 2 protein [bacterium]|nr:glycosyltransferase family 2 protein [bacterium]
MTVPATDTTPVLATRAETLVLIPAYCEENNILRVIGNIRREVPEVDILVIDDGSSDRTRDLAISAGVHVVSHPINMGYGTALQTGFKFALQHGYEQVVQIDGDGQHDPAYIPRLIERMRTGSLDVVLGSRFLDVESYRVPLARRVGQVLFGMIASRVLGRSISDPTTGYQALTRRAVALYASDLFPVDYPDADVIILAHLAGLKIDEVGVKMFPNAENKSMHSGFAPFYYVFKMCLSIAVTLLRERPRVAA